MFDKTQMDMMSLPVLQLVLPSPVVTCPSGQGVHVLALLVLVYVLMGQSIHCWVDASQN